MIVGIIAAVALADISLRPLNLTAFYMLPMILGAQHFRRTSSVLCLAIALIILSYFSLVPLYVYDIHRLARFRLINRGFVALALASSALLAVFYIRVRDYRLARQSALAPSDDEVFFLLQVFHMFEDVTAVLIATIFAIVSFVIDIRVPEEYNLAILYLIPLAVLALTRNRWLLWSATPILVTLACAGFAFGPPTTAPANDHWAIVANRTVAATAIVLVAALLHITSKSSVTASAIAPEV